MIVLITETHSVIDCRTASLRKQSTFATSPLVSPRNNVRGTRVEIPYRWRVTLQFLVVVLIGCLAMESCFNQSTTQIWVVTRHSVEFFRSVLRLQNKPYVCVAKNARTVKRKVWSKGDNREWDWDSLRAFTNRFWKKKNEKQVTFHPLESNPLPSVKIGEGALFFILSDYFWGEGTVVLRLVTVLQSNCATNWVESWVERGDPDG